VRARFVEAVTNEDAMTGTVSATVTRIHRGGEALQPGDTIEIRSDEAASGSELVAVTWSRGAEAAVMLYSEVTFPGGLGAASCGFSLNRDEYITVATAGDCPAALSRIDPNAARNDCDEGCSCSVPGASGDGSPTTFGILVALLSAAVWRRSRRFD
jgi:MYXO-CTERM domain-containing protein